MSGRGQTCGRDDWDHLHDWQIQRKVVWHWRDYRWPYNDGSVANQSIDCWASTGHCDPTDPSLNDQWRVILRWDQSRIINSIWKHTKAHSKTWDISARENKSELILHGAAIILQGIPYKVGYQLSEASFLMVPYVQLYCIQRYGYCLFFFNLLFC